MLAAIGAASLDELADAAVPAHPGHPDTAVPSTLPPAGTETEVLAALRALAARNTVTPALAAGMVAVHIRRGPWGYLHEPPAAAVSIGSLDELPEAIR